MNPCPSIITFLTVCSLALGGSPEGRKPKPDDKHRDRAIQLLGNYREGISSRIRSEDVVFVLETLDKKGTTVMSSDRVHLLMDFRNRRMAVEIFDDKDGKVATRIVILKDKGYKVDVERNDIDEFEPEDVARFQTLFDDARLSFLPIDTDTVEYVSSATYGDVLDGQEVRAKPCRDICDGLLGFRLVFTPDGRLRGVVREWLRGKNRFQITVFHEPVKPGDLESFWNRNIYFFDSDQKPPICVATTKLISFRIDEPFDADVFKVDEKSY